MNFQVWIDPRIANVRVQAVRDYMAHHGWTVRASGDPRLVFFEGPPDDEGNPIVQVIPNSERLADYRMRLEEIVTFLAGWESRHPVDILNEMLHMQNPITNGTAPHQEAPASAIPK